MADLMHYGTKRHSGRYPYGSGENPYQHENWFRWGSGDNSTQYESEFLKQIDELKSQGITQETDIAKALGISTTELRQRKALAKSEIAALQRARIISLHEQGYSNTAIAEKIFGDSKKESKVRYILNPVVKERQQITNNIAEILKKNVDEQRYIDVGAGTELYLGNVSKEKLQVALQKLQDEGYKLQYLKIEQVGNPGHYTWMKILTKDDVSWNELKENRDKIGFVEGFYTNDGGKTFLGIEKPTSIDSSRLMVRYKEDGGEEMDGVIQIRRGVEDLSLGTANYAQVRIAVDGTHYLKGMAVYCDDMPDGVDVIFNSNKHEGTPVLGTDKNNTVLKKMKVNKETGEIDWDNPFGTTLRMEDGKIVGQRHYIDENGETQLSPINIVRQEGDWNTWSNTLASQFLAKQPAALITQQLNISRENKEAEYNKIMQITQPEVRKDQLMQFANDCDASASELKAAALPRQSSKVLLPVTDLSDNEIYAPTYRSGEDQVALIRYPHGGIFEIPVLTVNNNNSSAKKMIGNSIDAVGINPNTAKQLSGADFDGDTVVVIPINNQKISHREALKELKDFDAKESYPAVDGMKKMTKKNTQTEMGKISNLITDMTLKGADFTEIARAVKHSMVVIDAEKHNLNYELSFEQNGIAELKEKYQGGKNAGASTLISQANAEKRVPLRNEKTPDAETGERVYQTDEKNLYYSKPKKNKEGEITGWTQGTRTTKTTRMAEVKDAHELSSGTIAEEIYADYANSMKAMANEARKEALATPSTKVNKSAKETYAEEVASLNSKLNNALRNAPKERKAQTVAEYRVEQRKKSNRDMDADELKKIRTQALAAARNEFGANKKQVSINITDREWDAIMSGALSSSKISQIISNTSKDRVKQLAMPRSNKSLSTTQINMIKSRAANGYTLGEIADSLGISVTTVDNVLKGKEGV